MPACPAIPIAAIRGGDAQENAAGLLALLDGVTGAYRDTVVLNAAAAFVVAGKVTALIDGARLAAESIDGGRARAALAAAQGAA